MGNSLPPPAGFDLVGSFARRRGTDVEIILARPGTALARSIELRLTKGSRSATGTAVLTEKAGEPRLEIRIERNALSNGSWRLRARDESRSTKKVPARLLVQGDRPLVLLWGSDDPVSLIPVRRYRVGTRQWAAGKLGSMLDAALRIAPDARAARIRAAIRRTARRALR